MKKYNTAKNGKQRKTENLLLKICTVISVNALTKLNIHDWVENSIYHVSAGGFDITDVYWASCESSLMKNGTFVGWGDTSYDLVRCAVAKSAPALTTLWMC